MIYKDAQKDYDWVRMSTNEIGMKSMSTVDERVNTAGAGTPVVVYNPLGWARSGDVKFMCMAARLGERYRRAGCGGEAGEITDFAR